MDRRYRPMPGGSWFPLVVFGAFALGAVVMVIATLTGEGPPILFTVLWLAIVGWNAYWFLWRFAGELWVDGTTLHWRTALRSGSVDVHEIEEIRPMKMQPNIEVIRVRGQRPVLTMATKGIGEFNDSIVSVRPSLPVRLGWGVRFTERLTLGRSRFR